MKPDILSDREYQVMCMLASGKTVSEIGVELSLSVKTISTYRVRVLEKLQFKNNAELMCYAIKQEINGLVCAIPLQHDFQNGARRRSA